jgi:LmbE family N-acetylglucosaminyl deacetylase
VSRPDATEATQREVTARGLPAELWRPVLGAAADLDQPARGPVTLVVPHPDDETLGAGGFLHRIAETGADAEVSVVFVTDGAAGYPGSTPAQQTELAAVRRTEALDALQALGLHRARAVFLDVPDGAVIAVEAALVNRLRPLFQTAALVLAPWPDDPHPDHQAVARAAGRAAAQVGVELWQYPIWMRHSIRPDDPRVELARLRVLRLTAAEQSAKQAAIDTHRSQVRSPIDGYGPVLPQHVLELFADGMEPFFLPADEGALR